MLLLIGKRWFSVPPSAIDLLEGGGGRALQGPPAPSSPVQLCDVVHGDWAVLSGPISLLSGEC